MSSADDRAAGPGSPAPSLTPEDWEDWPDDRLLDLRLCELGVRIEGSFLERRIHELTRELEDRGLSFRPYFWLSDEWFTPDGVPGIALPFYLAHPRLVRLERTQMLEAEGDTPIWCLQIMRHEVGHSIDNAYLLRRRRRRQLLFGKSSTPYPEFYTPRPYSKSYVLHLGSWYAQSHPDEDFAETFAVWLNPASMWRERYVGWPALKKLEYINELMREIGSKEPLVSTRRIMDPLSRVRRTLREHYRRKRRHYGLEYPNFYDRDLRRLFSDSPEYAGNLPATRFIARVRKEVRRLVAGWTGAYQYTIDRVLEEMTARCRELHLRMMGPEDRTKTEFAILVTVQTMNYLFSGRHRLAL